MKYTRIPKAKSMTFMATDLMYDWLNEHAAKMDISTSQVIREALEAYKTRIENEDAIRHRR